MTNRAKLLKAAVFALTIAILTALTLLLLYSRPLRAAILEPAVWLLQDVRRTLAKFPQAMLWGIALLLGCAALAGSWKRVLRSVFPAAPHARRRDPTVRPQNAQTVDSLARDVLRAPRHHVSRVRVTRELSDLAIRLIAKREGLSLGDAHRRLRSGDWSLDPEVRRFFAGKRAGHVDAARRPFVAAAEYVLSYLERYHQEV